MEKEMGMWTRFWTWYFTPHRFENYNNGRLYEILGIRFFKRYLPTSGDIVTRHRHLRRIAFDQDGVLSSLKRYELQTRNYEGRHIFGALSMLVISWWSIEFYGKGNWLVLLVGNIIINGYPIMLQRYNRIRILSVLNRIAPTSRL
jgi:hypothetical protein